MTQVPAFAAAPQPLNWERFFETHGAFIFAAVRRFGGPGIDPEDATQDVMMVVLRQHARFEGRSSLRTWLYRICINVAAEHRRKRRRRAAFEAVLEAVSFWRSKDEAPRLEARHSLARVQELMGHLPAKHRDVLVLCELEGLPTSEVASVLELPEPTVRARLHYARKEIMALMQQEKPK